MTDKDIEEIDDVSQILEEATKKADEILNSNDPLDSLKKECLDKVITGEDQNKQLIFVLLLSGKSGKIDPQLYQILLLMGQPGAGKSLLARLSKAFKTKEVGRFSEHALDYTDLSGYDILYIKEMGYVDEEKQGVSTIKFLSTEDGGYLVEYTIRDKESRHFTTEQNKIPPMTVITTTTRFMVDSQFDRRAWAVNPDESEAQTKNILAFKEEKEKQRSEVYLGKRKITDYDFAFKVMEQVIEKVEPCYVIVPYPNAITKILNTSHLRTRGDFDKILALIKLTSLLYQRKLPYKMIGEKKVLMATPEMFNKALEIALEPLTTMTLDIDCRIRNLLACLQSKKIENEGAEIHKKERVDIAKDLKTSEKTILRHLDLMRERGYVIEYPEEKGKAKFHKLQYAITDILSKVSSLKLDSKKFGTPDGTPLCPVSDTQNLQNEMISDFNKSMGQNGFLVYMPNDKQNQAGTYTAKPVCPILSDDTKQVHGTSDIVVSDTVSHTLPKTDKCCSNSCKFYKDNTCTKHPDQAIVPTHMLCLESEPIEISTGPPNPPTSKGDDKKKDDGQ